MGKPERGERCPSIDTLYKVCCGLKITLLQLLDFEADTAHTAVEAKHRIETAISGLKLKDVYEDHIEITQAMVYGEHGNVLKPPKSVSGYRSIPIDVTLYKILTENAVGDRVFPHASSFITKYWIEFRKNDNLNKALVLHALRHHYASKCLLLGIPQKYIAELMGHRDTSMIEKVYQHTFPSAMLGYAKMLRENEADLLKKLAMQNKMQNKRVKNRLTTRYRTI